jgi:fused signal recognition particle receptor
MADASQPGNETSSKEEGGRKGFFSRFRGKKRRREDEADSLPVVEDTAVSDEAQSDLEVAQPVEDDAEEPGKEKKSLFAKLRSGLAKTRTSLRGRLDNMFAAGRKIDEDLLEELEELLIGSDIGVQTSLEIIEKVRGKVDKKTLRDGEELKSELQKELLSILEEIPTRGLDLGKGPTVLLIVGVNGVGKTTTIGKLARLFREQDRSVVICAADTFRAAAVEQLRVWAERADVDIVMKEGSKDPAAVVFDALEHVKKTNADVLMIDTAGRLHNNPNLMNELSKMRRIIGRSFEDAPHHVLLILDAVTGQNGLRQAKEFVAKVGVSDLILTKLDGTAKGGIAIAIAKELNLPIQFIGVGEQMDDLLPFDSKKFVDSLFTD